MSTTPAPYPTGLPRPLASKSRSQPASFSLREPRRGAGYVQRTGTDVPVFWRLQWTLRERDATRLQLWFRVSLERGALPFVLPLSTEFGDVPHTLQFLSEDLLPHSSEGGVHTYSAAVMARALVVPQGYADAAGLIVALPDWDEWARALDLGVQALPEA